MDGLTARKNLLAGAALISLALISLVGEWVDHRRAADEPTEDATIAAADRVRAEYAPGDVVWVYPHWWEAPWTHLQGVGVGADTPPFPALLRQPLPDPVRLLEARRLWILTGFDRSYAVEDLIAAAPAPSVSEEVGPGVRVLRYDLPRPGIVQRLTDQLERVTVDRTKAKQDPIPCPAQGERFVCGLDRWLDVDVRTRDVAGHQVRWLYAHPGPHEGALGVTWSQVPRGEALLVRFGHTQAAVRRDQGLPTTVRILVDGKTVDEVTLDPHAYVMQRRLIPTTPGPPIAVRVEVQSPDPRWREVMLQAEILPEVPPTVESMSHRSASYGAPGAAR